MCSFAEQSFPRRRANFRRCIRFDSLEEHDVNINFPVANFSIMFSQVFAALATSITSLLGLH